MKRVALAFLAAALAGCASSDPDIATLASNSDQLIWEAGQKAYGKKQWENARQHFRRILDAFPQSEFAPAARLALADSHFNEGGTASYILAVSDYRDFVTLYPSHAKSDYAQFQTGECYFRQKNGPDRDQTQTREALAEFLRLLDNYPQSSYAETARLRITACRQSLARHEFQAGFFYQRTRRACRSAVARYEFLLKEYPDYDQTDEVLYRLGECLISSGRSKEALPHLQRLLDTFPESPRAIDAKTLMQKAEAVPAPGPSPNPAASPTPAPPGS